MAESASLTNAQSALCTKLSQLQKVVEYLNFHIEEHYFQIDEIQKRFEKEEDIIVNETQSEIESIYSSLDVEQTDIINKIDSDFKAQTNNLKSEMKQFQTKIMDETKNSIKDIMNELDHFHGKIKRITKEMKREISFLQDNSKVDPMNVQKKLRDLVNSHKMTLDAHDKESQRKQKLFEEQALSSQAEITKKYSKTINELKRKLRPPPQIRNQIIQSTKAIKKELFNMRNESNKVRSEAKKLATITFSSKLPDIYEVTKEMKKENEQFLENYEKMKTLLQDTIFQIKGEKNFYLEKLRNQRVTLAKEIHTLNEELICASDPVYLEKKKKKMEEEEIENHIKNLQKQIDEIKDLNALHEKEKNNLKIEFENEIKFENDLFEERKKIVVDQIETQKKYQEKQKEKESLLQYKKSLTLNQPSITIGQISVKTEINEIETLFNKEYSKAKIDKKDSISKYFLECDEELNRRKEETKNEYEKKMASITNEYKDNDVVKKVSQQYEELLLSLQSQLIKSENTDKNEEETEEEELKKLQAKFKAKINQERSDLIQNFEKLMQEEDQRFHNSPAFLDDTDYTDLLLAEKNKKKDFLSKYDDEIKLLEEDKDKIEESITLDENLKKVKEDSQFQIKCALQQKTDASKSLIAQISACSEKYSNLIHEESSTSSSSLPFQINYDNLNQEIQINRENNERQINFEKKTFERKSKSIKSTYSKASKKVQNEITFLKNSMQENEKQFDIEKQHRQSDFDMKIIQVEKEIVSQKPISTPTQLFIEYDNKINLLQRERDRQMRLYNNSVSKNGVKLMREQEREEIDRLEIELYDKTKQLAELGKNLVIAREISLKEKENNGVNDIKLNKEDNLNWQRRNVSASLSITTKPNSRKQVNSSVEIKRPNMSRTTGQILNFK